MKICRICKKSKQFILFSPHKLTKDRLRAECKACSNKMAKKHRKENKEYHLTRVRNYRLENIEKVKKTQKIYSLTENGKTRRNIGIRKCKLKNPHKVYAQGKFNSHVSRGLIKKQPCEVCGKLEKIHAHHDDYTKPLEVRWLCPYHHKQWHLNNKTKEL